jgi:hypothetical protein
MVRIATITLVASTRRIPHAASIGGLGIYLWTCGNALQYSIFSDEGHHRNRGARSSCQNQRTSASANIHTPKILA